METHHALHIGSASEMARVASDSIDLVVTSPPYPMVKMWDESFIAQNPAVGDALRKHDGAAAHALMHQVLERVWDECARVLRPGGLVCINIGDATRTLGEQFQMYANHGRIVHALDARGFQSLPSIVWRKTTNAPNKFMGSGTLPVGAYVTLEHEHILIARSGGKRVFESSQRSRRRASAFFWEERNQWFSDLWEVTGTRQRLDRSPSRKRSGAFPFEIAFRLINMFSVVGDTVLDPFLGTGTTVAAAMASARNSVGYEIDAHLSSVVDATLLSGRKIMVDRQRSRLTDHNTFVARYQETHGKPPTYRNAVHDVPVVTRNETELELLEVRAISAAGENMYRVEHERVQLR